jgi:hypothetical protein
LGQSSLVNRRQELPRLHPNRTSILDLRMTVLHGDFARPLAQVEAETRRSFVAF